MNHNPRDDIAEKSQTEEQEDLFHFSIIRLCDKPPNNKSHDRYGEILTYPKISKLVAIPENSEAVVPRLAISRTLMAKKVHFTP